MQRIHIAAITTYVALHHRRGQIRQQPLAHDDRPRARPAAPVRLRERLVQIRVHQVKPKLAQFHPSQQRVQIRPVAIYNAARVPHNPHNLQDVGIEQPKRAWQRYHQARQVFAHRIAQRLQIGIALRVRGQRDDIKSAHARRRRVSAMRAVRDKHLAAMRIPALPVIRPRHQHPREFAVRPRHRRKAAARHPCYLRQPLLQLPHQPKRPLNRAVRLMRMNLGESGQPRNLVVDLRVVLHCATAQRIEVVINGKVELANLRKVADDLPLAHLRKVQVLAQHIAGRWRLRRHVAFRQTHAQPARRATIHQQAAAIACQPLLQLIQRIHCAAPISPSAAANASISSRVFTSVAHTSITSAICPLMSNPPIIL